MAYLSLYRKYRSRNFEEIVGQDHVTRTLVNALKTGRIAHAYLFAGPRGTGKTSTARVLAKALNCEAGDGPTATPCDQCRACESIRQGSSFDVIEIDAASHRLVDDIEELRETVQYAPGELRYKVYIIDEVHMLSTHAFNALLKTLEEPPETTVFALCTTEPHKLLPTILSRCQRYDFRRVGVDDLEALLGRVVKAEKLKVEPAAIALLARAADGSARDALSLLEQAVAYAPKSVTAEDVQTILGGIGVELLAEFAEIIARRDAEAAFRAVDRVAGEGKDIRQLVSELVRYFRDLLLAATTREAESLIALPPAALESLRRQAKEMPIPAIMRALNLLAEAERDLRYAMQQRLILEVALARLCVETAAPTAAAEQARPATPMAGKPAADRPAPGKSSSPAGRPAAPAAGKPATPTAGRASTRPSKPLAESPGEVTIEFVRERWPALMERLKADRQMPIVALLREADPASLEEGRLTITFAHEFHYSSMKAKRDWFQDYVSDAFGTPVKVVMELAEGADEGKGNDLPEPPPKRNAVHDVMSLFPNAKVVKDK
jgi:DNA polymerase-3 subunit gamma/tau